MSLSWARLTISALEAAGVRHIVVCPGSRSAPLAVASAESGLQISSVIDERSAAFFALGVGRASGVPAVVICTSGTAGAHFYPAIIEASYAAVPMIVITADRPAELKGCGASQTINQERLFGDFVRVEANLGCAVDDPTAREVLSRTVFDAARAASGPHPGPVHLNAPARKPLLATTESTSATTRSTTRSTTEAPAAPHRPDAQALTTAAERLSVAKRLIVCVGPIDAHDKRTPAALVELATTLGAPVFAEVSSQLRFAANPLSLLVEDFDGLLRRDGFGTDSPDAILEVGAPLTSAGYARVVSAHPEIARVVLRPHLPLDPFRSAQQIIVGELATSIETLASAMGPIDPAFAAAWRERAARGRATLETTLGSLPMTGQSAMRSAIAALPSGGQLVVGNSLPIRWIDQAVPSQSRALVVHTQRGVAGIDGLIAGAAGAAAATGRPTLLLLGDVSCAHDIGSLAVAATAEAPLVIAVLDNGGGQIFFELPYAEGLSDDARRLFQTTPSLDVRQAAVSFGVQAAAAATPEAVSESIAAAMTRGRATLVWIPIAERSPEVLA